MPRALPLIFASLALAACGPKAADPAAGGKFAGLDGEIREWRETLMKTRSVCTEAPADKACQSFEVACKGEKEITSADAAKGVTARVVAAMTYSGWDATHGEFSPASAFAEFAKTGETWTRREIGPLNLTTCAVS